MSSGLTFAAPSILVRSQAPQQRHWRPNPGGQTVFLGSRADIAVFGGKAGAGKTQGLLGEPLRHVNNPAFGAVAFRRTAKQLMTEGGLWDEACMLYPPVGAKPRASQGTLDWRFPAGACVSMSAMEHEHDKYNFDGAQICLELFDQLEHFTEGQFFYMLSRNRSTCGVEPYVRATCNPNPDSFLRWLMAWWIDEATGLAIPERSGVIRYFVRAEDGEIFWADTVQELILGTGCDADDALSFTFILGDVYENRPLLEKDPRYISRLKGMQKVDRQRLLEGNWNARETAGSFFQRDWFGNPVPVAPTGFDDVIRYWDRAGTDASKAGPGASWTAGVKLGKIGPLYFVLDVERFQKGPAETHKRIRAVAEEDGLSVIVGIEQDPGQAGKFEAHDLASTLDGFDVEINVVRENKGLRAKPVSAQVEIGNVKVVRAEWNEAFLRECENFDGSKECTSDQVDAFSGAHHMLSTKTYAGVLR